MAELVAKARAAQRIADDFDQARVDELVSAAGWAIIEPGRNRELAELAVADTGIGNVDDKVRKNHRKTFGLLRDLQGARSVGVIAEDAARGLVEIARPVGVVCAITPSTNPGATPANKIINALKGRNAVIVAPSPKGWGTCARLIEFIHAQFDRIGAPRDLVQLLPSPVSKQSTTELMKRCDLVVATGSQANVRAAYASGTPAFGVGAGNVAGIVDETVDVELAAERIVRSKTFDNATSCSSENSLVIVDAVRDRLIAALTARGAVLLSAAQKTALGQLMWPDGKLSPAVIGQSAPAIVQRALAADGAVGWAAVAQRQPAHPDGRGRRRRHRSSVLRRKAQPGAGAVPCNRLCAGRADCRAHLRLRGRRPFGRTAQRRARARPATRPELPVSRVIVDQAHCIATGGSFDNGLPFSLSMGCGTWGKNNFSDNMNYRHYLNITRISRPIAEVVPSERDIFGAYFDKFGRA